MVFRKKDNTRQTPRNPVHKMGRWKMGRWFRLILAGSMVALAVAVPAGDATLSATAQVQPSGNQSAARKGIIWRAEHKWATENGEHNWAGIESDLQDMRNAGVKWVRIAFRENFPLSYYERLVPLVGEYDIEILANARKANPAKELGTPAQQDAYRAWLSQVVTRFENTIQYWEIENETNISAGWNICLQSPCEDGDLAAYQQGVEEYVQLLQLAYETIKEVDPSLQVLIGGLCECGAERYVGELIRLDAQRYFDIMAYHPFGRSPDEVIQRLDAIQAKMASQPALAAKPIWITAIGFHTANWAGTPGRVYSEEVKADYLLQTMGMLSEADGVEGPIFWYILSEPIAEVNGYGLMYKDASTEPLQTTYLPAYDAYKELWVTKYVQVLPAIEDDFVSRNHPTGSYGSSDKLRVGYGTDIRQAYMKFDLTGLAGHRLLQTQLRFLTSNIAGAGSAATQLIKVYAASGWTEADLNFANQPMPVAGTISDTMQGMGYQVWLDESVLQRAVGGELSLTIHSHSADELVIQSREWHSSLRLIVYYSPSPPAAATGAAVEAPSADELAEIEPITEPMTEGPPVLRIEEPYDWNADQQSGAQRACSYEMPPCGAEEEIDIPAEPPAIYLPYIAQ